MTIRRTTRLFLYLVLVLMMASALQGCATLGVPAALQLVITRSRSTLIVKSDDDLGWGQLSHPYLCPLSDQRIMLTYYAYPEAQEGADVTTVVDWPAYTDDGGRSWQFGDPMNWVDGPPPLPTYVRKGQVSKANYGYCFGLVALSNGLRIAQTRKCFRRAPQVYEAAGIWSEDGVNWHGPRVVTYHGPTNVYYPDMLVSPRALQLKDGTLLGRGYTKVENQDKYSTLLFKSDDDGVTYEFLSYIATAPDAPWGNQGPCEPGLAQVPNGDLVCVMRTGGQVHDMLQARSEDGGRTWTRRRINKAGVMPNLMMMRNGVLVCTYGRPGNNIMFSTNGGRSWGREIAVVPQDVLSSGYLDIWEVEPDRLLVVYDTYNAPSRRFWLWEPPSPVNALWWCYVDVHRLGFTH